jgi:ubiquinone biosynthesis protein COQ4
MKKIYYFMKLLMNLSRIARNPENTQAALDIGKCLRKLGLLASQMKRHQLTPATVEFISNRTLLPAYSLLDLQNLPLGSVGRTYADHMIHNGLNPNFYDRIEGTDDIAYIMMRMRETHDLWHIMTGFGTTVPEELGLQAFMYAQIRTPLATILIAGRTLVATFKNPEEVPKIFDQVTKGWTMGNKAKQLFSYRWENNWSTPLSQARAEQLIS